MALSLKKFKAPIGAILFLAFVLLNFINAIRVAVKVGPMEVFNLWEIIALISCILFGVLVLLRYNDFLLLVPVGAHLVYSLRGMINTLTSAAPGGSAISTAVLSFLVYVGFLGLVIALITKKDWSVLVRITVILTVIALGLIWLVNFRLQCIYVYNNSFSVGAIFAALFNLIIATLKAVGLAFIARWLADPEKI